MLRHGPTWGKNIPHLWLNNLQISHDEYTLFSANIFVGLCAAIKSIAAPEKFGISKRKVECKKRYMDSE